MNAKRLIAFIAVLAMLLSSTALAASIYNPSDMVDTYNSMIFPAYDELTGDSDLANSLARDLKVVYDTDSTAGDISYWIDSWHFCISFDGPDRYSKSETVHFYCNTSEDSLTGVLPLLPAVLAITYIDQSVDPDSLFNWVMAMQDGSRFDAPTWHAYMSVADDGGYMGFTIFPN